MKFSLVMSAVILGAMIGGGSTGIARDERTMQMASAHRSISTSVPAAQAAFDQGLLMLYAFNTEAARSYFARAAMLDPNCAMAFWGEAVSEVIDINESVSPAAYARGKAAIVRARTATEASHQEREIIEALGSRFRASSAMDENSVAYAEEMDRYACHFPRDVDGLVVSFFAAWNAYAPHWDSPAFRSAGEKTQRAVALDSTNLGALHAHIHFLEIEQKAAAAVNDAQALQRVAYLPGTSHIIHMAGHVYLHTGDYALAASVNEEALQNDFDYRGSSDAASSAYLQKYHQHVLENALYALTTIGFTERAMHIIEHEDPFEKARLDLRMHRWKAVTENSLAEPFIAALAYARLGDADHMHQMELRMSASPMSKLQRDVFSNLIAAEYDRSSGRPASEVGHSRQAYALSQTPFNDPPFDWVMPIGYSYGGALLRTHKYKDAERVFQDQLLIFPGDPHLLYGLSIAQRELHHSQKDISSDSYQNKWKGVHPLSLDSL